MSERHVFRFFVSAVGATGACVPLDAADVAHLDVLRRGAGDEVEVVDGGGVVWRARVADDGAAVELVEAAVGAAARDVGAAAPQIRLVAGALTGSAFDQLVDAAVQAGATQVVPFVSSRRDGDRLRARRARLQRVARAAAKQAKRPVVPTIDDPLDVAALVSLDPGFVLDTAASERLDLALAPGRHPAVDSVTLLVGPAEGLRSELVERLVEQGWVRCRLGRSVLRAELAAPVAVAVASLVLGD